MDGHVKFRVQGEIEAADAMDAYQKLEDYASDMQSVEAGLKPPFEFTVAVAPVEPQLQQQEDDG